MLGIPTIDLASGRAPTLGVVRSACRRLRLCMLGAFVVVAYLISSDLAALNKAHMSATYAASTVASGPWLVVKGLAMIALFGAAVFVLYRSLVRHEDLRLCDNSSVCRMVYAVCRAHPQADRYRQAVVQQGRRFIAAEIDAFYKLFKPELWVEEWSADFQAQVLSPAPLAVAATG